MPFSYACDGCGKQFTAKLRQRGARAFCSRDCYHQATIIYPDKECRKCGVTFSPRSGPRSGPRIASSDRTYCSATCYQASRPRVTKTCPECGKEFTVSATNARRYRVCSNACKVANAIYVNCQRCGKRFNNSDARKRTRHFCSEECRRPPVIIACRNCAKQFRKCPGEDSRQFCSLSCYRSFVGETLLEARIRVALESLGVPFEQEFAVGRWSIDFALVGQKIAIEADGDYWHKLSSARDKRRDARLGLAGWRTVRLAEKDVNSALNLPRLILDRVPEVAGPLALWDA